MVLGHWGTTPGQNFIYVHLNRVIKAYDLDMFYIAGPGHGGPALAANTYLEGTYSERYPNITQDEEDRGDFEHLESYCGLSGRSVPATRSPPDGPRNPLPEDTPMETDRDRLRTAAYRHAGREATE